MAAGAPRAPPRRGRSAARAGPRSTAAATTRVSLDRTAAASAAAPPSCAMARARLDERRRIAARRRSRHAAAEGGRLPECIASAGDGVATDGV